MDTIEDKPTPLYGVNGNQSSLIKLNVGGKKFTTTLSTLTHKTDSMLAAMFSGRYGHVMDDEGNIFIDRDGELFGHVLAFLREGEHWEPPTDSPILRRVAREFDYYGLECSHFTPTEGSSLHDPKTFVLKFGIQLGDFGWDTGHPTRGYTILVLKQFTVISVQLQCREVGVLKIALNNNLLQEIVMTRMNDDWIKSKDNFSFTFQATTIYSVFLEGGREFGCFNRSKSFYDDPLAIGEYVIAESKIFQGFKPIRVKYSPFFLFTCIGEN